MGSGGKGRRMHMAGGGGGAQKNAAEPEGGTEGKLKLHNESEKRRYEHRQWDGCSTRAEGKADAPLPNSWNPLADSSVNGTSGRLTLCFDPVHLEAHTACTPRPQSKAWLSAIIL